MKKLIFAALIAAVSATSANAQINWIWHVKPPCANCPTTSPLAATSCDANVTVRNSVQISCNACQDMEACVKDFSQDIDLGNINVTVKATSKFDFAMARGLNFTDGTHTFSGAFLRTRLAGGLSTIGGTIQNLFSAFRDPGDNISLPSGLLAILQANAGTQTQQVSVRLAALGNLSIPDGVYTIPVYFFAHLNP